MKLFFLLSAIFLWSAIPALAVDILTAAENMFFDPADETRFGVEVEFKGLTIEEAAKLIAEKTGKLTIEDVLLYGPQIGTDANGEPIYSAINTKYYYIKTRALGTLTLKPEFNNAVSISSLTAVDPEAYGVELVSEVMRWPQMEAFQAVVSALEENGAIGTEGENPLGTHVNVEAAEIPPGREKQARRILRREVKPANIVNQLRNTYHPEHREQILARDPIPEIRQKYVGPYTPGFEKVFLNPNYKPNMQTLYFDVVYRQSVEILGYKDAWTMPASRARRILLSQTDPVIPKVVKFNDLRITSLLCYLFPDDPMSEFFVDGWIGKIPVVETRRPNTDFNVTRAVKRALGLQRAANIFGYYDSDKLQAAISGLDEATIKLLRDASLQSEVTGEPFVYRYSLDDPKVMSKGEWDKYKKLYGGVASYLPAQPTGLKPVVVPGESIVLHRLPHQVASIIGKYNPTGLNALVQLALENKYVEALFWRNYISSFPDTENLAKVIKNLKNPAKIAVALNKRFPKGWVIKGTFDSASMKNILTSDMDIANEIAIYQASDFDKVKAALERQLAGLDAAENIFPILMEHPGYFGWKFLEIFSDANLALVQEKMDIEKEFRVEVIGGKVLGKGSTQDRYAFLAEEQGLPYEYSSAAEIKRVEAYAQSVVNSLPPELRGLTLGLDVAILKEGTDSYEKYGRFALVEGNPQGNSGYRFNDEKTIQALNNFLKDYPKNVKNGKLIGTGMAPRAQIKFLRGLFKQWGIDVAKIYPGFTFGKDFIDAGYEVVEPHPSTYSRDCGYAAIVAKKLPKRRR